MDKFANHFFSMRMMAVGMFIFMVAIGGATFLESVYDVQTSKIYIYNAFWFNLLLTYLSFNLIANIIRHKMIQLKKWALLLFHLSFLVIMIGAAVTRFLSFEGQMQIPEGQSSNFIYSSNPYLAYRITDFKQQYTHDHETYLSELDWWNDFSHDIEFPNHKTPITIEYVDFHKNMVDSVVTNDSIRESSIELIFEGKSHYIAQNNFEVLGEVAFSFEKKNALPGVEFFKQGNKVLMRVMQPGSRSLPMSALQVADRTNPDIADSLYREIPVGVKVPLEMATLYMVGNAQFVFKSVKKNTKKLRLQSEVKNEGLDDLVIKITDGNKSTIQTLTGGLLSRPAPVVFMHNGLEYRMTYGPKIIDIPFNIMCKDFRLERYPGSDAPSSFESDVKIIDAAKKYEREQTIFMNHVMDYRGYRFFQSSYFPDETGTVLSVNHDAPGTIITYIGYLLMTIGMIMSLFAKNSRFRELARKLEKSRERRAQIGTTLLLAFAVSTLSFAQETETHDHEAHDHAGHDHAEHDHAPPAKEAAPKEREGIPVHYFMSEEVSDEMATVLVQDFRGRIIPLHTMADQLMRKVRRANTYEGKNAVQTVVSLHMYPGYWIDVDFIHVSSKGGLRDKFKGASYVSFVDLTNPKTGQFIFEKEYADAFRKREGDRGEYEKQLLKLGERYQIMGGIWGWQSMVIVPLKNDPNNKWYVPLSAGLRGKDTLGSSLALQMFTAIDYSSKKNKFDKVLESIKVFKEYQYNAAGKIAPNPSVIAMEVRYNKMNIFKNSAYMYLLIGFSMLIVFFFQIFIRPTERAQKRFRIAGKIFMGILLVIFLYHGAGLAMRAYITGYAPWSNGYEAVVFIGFVTMLCGFIFGRKNMIVMASAAILAFLMLYVTEMELMDPEITPMQPVLKSYWLKIHVAVITGSYAPLGIACILSFMTLILYVFRNSKNKLIVNVNITELTFISEMAMTIGVFMLTIGTFLGGIWANESWGRYWGWDPKETWALVAVLAYAIILHFRFIPGLKGKFAYNVAAFWGYSTILFTFFGVNFMLVGLHSYAQGDGLGSFPVWLTVTIICFAVFTGIAIFRNRRFSRSQEETE